MDKVTVYYIDDVYLGVDCDDGIAYEISDYFTFFVPGYQFTPSYKSRYWDGKIRLFNVYKKELYVGLLKKLEKFCKDRDYEFIIASKELTTTKIDDTSISKWIEKISPTLEPYSYQLDTLIHVLNHKRSLVLSPTASGKSFIIYLLMRYLSVPTLIIVPTTSLVRQMYTDFEDYGFNSEKYIHQIYSGYAKDTTLPVVITTWQSIYKLPKEWFSRFKLCIGDEAHGFKAKSLTSIMTKMNKCPHKVGFTGTLDGTETNKLVLEGLFGPVYQAVTTKELMDRGVVAQLNIECLILEYSDSIKKSLAGKTYNEEMNFLVGNNDRNNFIKNLALSLKGNTLIMFRFVDKHGKVLRDLIQSNTDRPVYFVSGSTHADDREEIRKILEREKNAIAICSDGTFSTGVNVKNLHNVIFSSPSKARIKILQSIGRGLRISETKSAVTLYDIADDLSWKSKDNHTLKHFIERIKIYIEQQFSYKIHKIRIGK